MRPSEQAEQLGAQRQRQQDADGEGGHGRGMALLLGDAVGGIHPQVAHAGHGVVQVGPDQRQRHQLEEPAGDEADALHMACTFVKKDIAGHAMENIFIVDGFIYASDGFYGIRYPTAAPNMVISPQCAAVVQDGSRYVQSGNYTCIVSPDGSTRHLFITPEATVPAFKTVFRTGDYVSTINTAEIITGLKIVQQMASEKLVIAEIGDGRILYKEDAYGTLLDYSVTTGNFASKVNVQPLLPLLSAIPQTQYDVHQVAPGFFYLNDGDLYIFFTTIQN